MLQENADPAERLRAARLMSTWLVVVGVMVVGQIVLGAVTRLTDSGLSITEWKPILGVVPPLNPEQWQTAFEKYQQIPQFKQLKSQMSLEEFKGIYFWEWAHRLWGRLLGLAFAVPGLWFWRKGWLLGRGRTLLGLFALGGLQGLMGWIMVASGLQELVYVSHFRLAAHLLLALLLLVALLWVALSLRHPAPAKWDRATAFVLGLLAVQLMYGAFMAGMKAALYAPTWPTINGTWIPQSVQAAPWPALHWVNDPVSVHFVHRGLGYVLVLAIIWWARRMPVVLWKWPVTLVALQVTLGILVTIRSPIAGQLLVLGVVHQLVAVLLLCSLTLALHRKAGDLTPAGV